MIHSKSSSRKNELLRLGNATAHSLDGLKAAYEHEKAFRLEAWLAIVFIPLSFLIGQTWIEVTLLAGSIIAIMAAELVNSAIEAAIDRVSLDIHEISKRAKDYGSACVFICALYALCIWLYAIASLFT